MKLLSRWFGISLPITLVVFLCVTMRTESVYPAQSSAAFEYAMTAFGFPFRWYSPVHLLAPAYKIAIVPLVADLLVYCVGVLALQYLFADRVARGVQISRRTLKVVSIFLWLVAIVTVTGAVFIVTLKPTFGLTSKAAHFVDDEHVVHRRSIIFGFLPDHDKQQQ
jgi:hypothetical protein